MLTKVWYLTSGVINDQINFQLHTHPRNNYHMLALSFIAKYFIIGTPYLDVSSMLFCELLFFFL